MAFRKWLILYSSFNRRFKSSINPSVSKIHVCTLLRMRLTIGLVAVFADIVAVHLQLTADGILSRHTVLLPKSVHIHWMSPSRPCESEHISESPPPKSQTNVAKMPGGWVSNSRGVGFYLYWYQRCLLRDVLDAAGRVVTDPRPCMIMLSPSWNSAIRRWWLGPVVRGGLTVTVR
jgi:hypothetical protein